MDCDACYLAVAMQQAGLKHPIISGAISWGDMGQRQQRNIGPDVYNVIDHYDAYKPTPTGWLILPADPTQPARWEGDE